MALQPFIHHLLVASAMTLQIPLWAAATPSAPAACGAGLHEHTSYNGTNVAPVVRGLASVADCCKLCSENAQCQLYSWHPVGSSGQPTWCALQAGDGAFAPSKAPFVAGAVPPAEHQSCSSSLDCSLAGECIAGRCRCDGWTHGPGEQQHFLLSRSFTIRMTSRCPRLRRPEPRAHRPPYPWLPKRLRLQLMGRCPDLLSGEQEMVPVRQPDAGALPTEW